MGGNSDSDVFENADQLYMELSPINALHSAVVTIVAMENGGKIGNRYRIFKSSYKTGKH